MSNTSSVRNDIAPFFDGMMNLFLSNAYDLIMNLSKHFRMSTLGIISIFSRLVLAKCFFCLEFSLLTKRHHFSTKQKISPYSTVARNRSKNNVSYFIWVHDKHDECIVPCAMGSGPALGDDGTVALVADGVGRNLQIKFIDI